jgi:hypothetical protein
MMNLRLYKTLMEMSFLLFCVIVGSSAFFGEHAIFIVLGSVPFLILSILCFLVCRVPALYRFTQHIGISVVVPAYTPAQYKQYQDGFAIGYPLVGQPMYPVHHTEAFRRGLRYGMKAYRKAGYPLINYEEPAQLEEVSK